MSSEPLKGKSVEADNRWLAANQGLDTNQSQDTAHPFIPPATDEEEFPAVSNEPLKGKSVAADNQWLAANQSLDINQSQGTAHQFVPPEMTFDEEFQNELDWAVRIALGEYEAAKQMENQPFGDNK